MNLQLKILLIWLLSEKNRLARNEYMNRWYRESRERIKDKLNARCRARYAENIEKERQRSRSYAKLHPEKARARAKRFEESHPGLRAQQIKQWAEDHPEQTAEKSRRYDLTHPERRKAISRAYNERHRERRREQWRRSNKKANAERVRKRWQRYLTDPAFNVNIKVRRSIWSALNKCKKGLRKTDKTINILGCSFDELKVHIESQFKPGMTWDMVLSGEIHLDHIRPVAKFNLLDPEEVKRCFHFSNLQPLFKLDNLSKRDRVAPEYGNATT